MEQENTHGSVSGMSQGVHHRVVGGAGLGEESREQGYEGGEAGLIEEKSLVDNRKKYFDNISIV